MKGGVDTHVYKSDTVLIDATAMDNDSNYPDAGNLILGLVMFHSPYLSSIYVPVKYGLTDNFHISFSIPDQTKTCVYNNNHNIINGFGDIMLGLTGSVQPFRYFSSSTTARGTLPTGNVNAQENSCFIPMGYGGYTASLQQSISFGTFDAGFISIRLFLRGIGIYYFKSTTEIDTTTKYNYDKTYMWAAIGGIDLGLTKKLNIELKADYINIKERRYKIETVPATSGDWIDADDSVKQINILPFVRYRFFDDLSGQAGIIYPFKTTQDSDITQEYDAQWKVVMGIEKRFSVETSSNNEVTDRDTVKKPAEIKKPAVEEEKVITTDAVEEKVAGSTGTEEEIKKEIPKKKSKKIKRRKRRK